MLPIIATPMVVASARRTFPPPRTRHRRTHDRSSTRRSASISPTSTSCPSPSSPAGMPDAGFADRDRGHRRLPAAHRESRTRTPRRSSGREVTHRAHRGCSYNGKDRRNRARWTPRHDRRRRVAGRGQRTLRGLPRAGAGGARLDDCGARRSIPATRIRRSTRRSSSSRTVSNNVTGRSRRDQHGRLLDERAGDR